MAKSDLPRLAVLGAGPIGIEAALIARGLGWPVTIYERGRLAEHLERWGHVKLFTPFAANSTALARSILKAELGKANIPGDGDILSGREHVAAYLAPLAASPPLEDCLKLESHVIAVGRRNLFKAQCERRAAHPFLLLLRDSKGNETTAEADVVFDCTGIYSRHRFLGAGGLPAGGELASEAQIAYGLEDILGGQRTKYAGTTVLLVGDGYTAATHACMLADLAATASETWVTWLSHGARSSPMPRVANDPFKDRDKLAVRANSLATRGEGNIEFRMNSVVEKVVSLGQDKGFQITARTGDQSKTWEVDRVIASVGYSPESSLYRELQVQECPVTQAAAALGAVLQSQPEEGIPGHSFGPAALRTAEPNYFILGAKSFGRHPGFFLKTGFAQLRDVFSGLTGKPAASFAGE